MNCIDRLPILAALIFALFSVQQSSAAVEGRYVCYGNGLSPILGVAEFEVWSGGKNVVAKRAEDFTLHCITGRDPESNAPHFRNLVDGNTNTLQRWPQTLERCATGMGYKDGALSHCAFEVDLGQTIPVDKIELYRSRYVWDDKHYKLFQDLGWRYILILNDKRQIVSWTTLNIYAGDWRKIAGHWTLMPQPAEGAPASRVVPKKSLNWLSEAEFIRDFLGKPTINLNENLSPEDRTRLKNFEHRNDPAAIQKLGEDFFRVVDLERPGLAAVKQLVEQGKYAEALEAFKGPFFQTISILKKSHGKFEYTWVADTNSRMGMRARDLMNHVYGDKEDLTVKQFTPGLLPPAQFVYPFQMRPLLLSYVSTGDPQYLHLWESMTDDWSMGFQEAADKDPKKLRDHFVLIGGPVMDNLLDLVNASLDRPDFIKALSGATLARYLLPILEEMPVSIWRVCRTCTFNHTFNAIPGGLKLSQALKDFHAGQRLEREMQQAFERLYTYNLYRDGSMVEIGDEGHYMSTVVSPGNLYGEFVNNGRPAWFTPGLETYFLDHYRANILSHVKNTSPSGVHARWSANSDQLGSLGFELDIREPHWRKPTPGFSDYFPTICTPFLQEPEPRAIVDTVYGRGRPPFNDKTKASDQNALTNLYSGTYQGKPRMLSDWLPYTGLWYFRGGWEHEDSFLHMVKPSHPNNLGGGVLYPVVNSYGAGFFNDTSYRFHDYATPLMTGLGVLIDGVPPCPELGRVPSGSKQSVFTQAIEKPPASRWYTDAQLDFGEAIYQGSYRDERLDFDHKLRKPVVFKSAQRVDDVTTTRQIFQVRPARLFLQVDRLRYADSVTHTNTLKNMMILTQPEGASEPSNDQLLVQPEEGRIVTINPDNAGVIVSLFGQPDLDITINPKEIAHGSFRRTPTITLDGYRNTKGREVLISWQAKDETVLLSLLRGVKPGEKPIETLRDISTGSAVGIRATMTNGVDVTLLVARKPPALLSSGPVSITGEALLLVEQPGQRPGGIVLGAEKFTLSGKTQRLATSDFKFVLDEARKILGFITTDNGLRCSAILRPLDPPTIGPAVNTFSESTSITITSKSPDVEIEYIAESWSDAPDGTPVGGPSRASVNATDWTRYQDPFTIDKNTFVRARVHRKGIAEIPFTSAGIDASAISYGFFHKATVQPALVQTPKTLTPGLNYDYLEGRWFALWSYGDRLPAKKTGTTKTLMDVSMRETDDPFAVRYHGYIDIPADGVYTFYGPKEFVNNICEPGYDLRLYIDDQEWYLGQTWHGLGLWSLPLQKGLHRFKVTYADARAKDLENQRIDLAFHYPWAETTWRGIAPVLEISGPKLKRQPVPAEWLRR